MSFFKNFDWSFKSVAKVIGLALLGVAAISVIIALIGFSFRTVFQKPAYFGGGSNFAYEESADGYFAEPMTVMSRSKMSLPPIPEPGFSTGEDAENFEVKTYSAQIKTRKLENTCKVISDLKSKEEVIFETSNESETNCSYRFKVKKESEAPVLAIIESLKPEDLNQNIQTIKGTIEAYDKQLDILQKKLASVEETLESAQQAYDNVQDLATKQRDVESLSTIIDNKLKLIDKLTSERLNIKTQIDSYMQSKADQMERLNYSFFNVNIFKDKIFDWKEIKESWKTELKALVRNFNEVLQGISVNLVTYMVRFVQVALYFFISLFLLKYVWIATKRIWKGRKRK